MVTKRTLQSRSINFTYMKSLFLRQQKVLQTTTTTTTTTTIIAA